jgi:hypothetical protein
MPPQPKSIMRSLGEAMGILWHAATKDVSIEKTTAKHDVEETHLDAPDGRVTLRRTVIEEIEFEPDESPPQGSKSPS